MFCHLHTIRLKRIKYEQGEITSGESSSYYVDFYSYLRRSQSTRVSSHVYSLQFYALQITYIEKKNIFGGPVYGNEIATLFCSQRDIHTGRPLHHNYRSKCREKL